MKLLQRLFGKDKAKYPDPEPLRKLHSNYANPEREAPPLRVNHSVIPASYINHNKGKGVDMHLYNNAEVFDDINDDDSVQFNPEAHEQMK